MGVKKHWILDGPGAITGVLVGQSGGSNRELLPDLQNVLAPDGVHLRPAGYKNLSKSIANAIAAVLSKKS
jgi:lysophospholipase L1-like esterase